MKTSFYFVLWIGIYPVLDLIPSQGLQEYSFLVALFIVFGISWMLRRHMLPTMTYDNAYGAFQLLENLYEGKVDKVKHQITRQAVVETLSAAYFAVTTVVLLYVILHSEMSQLYALIIFVFLAIGTTSRAARLLKASGQLRSNPSPEDAILIAQSLYGFNYADYYERRQSLPLSALMPPRPKYFTWYLGVSLLTALVCTAAGVAFGVFGVLILAKGTHTPGATGAGIINMLYGTLAAYFGIRDAITTISQLRSKY